MGFDLCRKQNGHFDIRPIGLNALNMVRIEAAFIMPGEDFVTQRRRADRVRSPFELGLSWLILTSLILQASKPFYGVEKTSNGSLKACRGQ